MQGASDFYVVLGLDPRATDREIARAYRSLLRQHHPDTAPSPATPRQGALERERLAEIMEAHQVLSDPARRARYDRGRQTPTDSSLNPKLREPDPGSAAGVGMSLKISPLRWEPPARRCT